MPKGMGYSHSYKKARTGKGSNKSPGKSGGGRGVSASQPSHKPKALEAYNNMQKSY